jgi:SET domain-containing protein
MGVFWYVNHAKRPGLVFQKQRLSALRDIAAGEELTLYYSDLLTHPKNKLWVKPSDI